MQIECFFRLLRPEFLIKPGPAVCSSALKSVMIKILEKEGNKKYVIDFV